MSMTCGRDSDRVLVRKFVFSIDVEKDILSEDSSRGIEEGLPLILNLLDKYHVKATIFVNGETAEQFPSLIKELAKRHEIACHGYSNEDMGRISRKEQFHILQRATEAIERVAGRPCGYRAPRLSVNPDTFSLLKEFGYRYDSSLPQFGLKNLRYPVDYIPGDNIVELRCIPTYSIRLFGNGFVSRYVVETSLRQRGYCIFFTHPWEAIAVLSCCKSRISHLKELAFCYNYIRTGRVFLERLDYFLNTYHVNPGFQTAWELAQELS